MKKFLICFASFLLLFGATTASAGVYTEDFDDGDLDPPWWISGENEINYEIIDGELRVYHGEVETWYVISNLNSDHLDELIYQFEADIKVSSGNEQEVGLHHYLWEPTGSCWHIYYLMRTNTSEIVAELERDDTIIDVQVLGTFNVDEWYSLSIALHDDRISFRINGNKTDLFHGLFQKPSSLLKSAVQIKAMADLPYDIEYYTDNVVAYSSNMFRGDFDGDGDCDGSDLATFADVFGKAD